MTDIMLQGVLRMPYEMAMENEWSRRQFHDRAQQAADRIEELEGIVRDLIALADSAMADANRDGGEYDRAGELHEARAALGE